MDLAVDRYLMEESRIGTHVLIRLYVVGDAGFEVTMMQDCYRDLDALTVWKEDTLGEALARKVWLCKIARAMNTMFSSAELDVLQEKGLIDPTVRHDSEAPTLTTFGGFQRMISSMARRRHMSQRRTTFKRRELAQA